MKKILSFLLSLTMLLSITGCNKNNDTSSADEPASSSESLVDVVTNESYYWSINENKAYNNDFIFSASTNESNSSLKVFVDNIELDAGNNHEVMGIIKYDLK